MSVKKQFKNVAVLVKTARANRNLSQGQVAFKLGFKQIDMSTVGPRPKK